MSAGASLTRLRGNQSVKNSVEMALASAGYIYCMLLQVAGVSATVADVEGHPRSSTEMSVSLLVEGVSPAYSCRWMPEEVH